MSVRGLSASALLLMLSVCASAQVYEPPWRPIPAVTSAPVVSTTPNAQAMTAWSTNKPTGSSFSPYYRESPLYQPGGIFYGQTLIPVAPSTSMTPHAVVSQPMVPTTPVVPQQPYTHYPQPQQIVPQQPAPQVVTPAPIPQQAPPVVQQQPAPAPIPSRAVASTRPPITVSEPGAPFENQQVFVASGQEWREYSIKSYTSRFPPSEAAENAVRDWILKYTGDQTWHGPDTASLAVSPEKVRVYERPDVQEKVAGVLGRFLYYTPGQFYCRVLVVNAESDKWQKRYESQLAPVPANGSGNQAWLLKKNAASELAAEFKKARNDFILVDRSFVVANGQSSRVEWNEETRGAPLPLPGVEKPVQPTGDGVVFEFSPLIAADASTVEIATQLSAQNAPKKPLLRINPFVKQASYEPITRSLGTAEHGMRFSVPQGRHLVISLARTPSFNPRRRLLSRKKNANIVVLLGIEPDPTNMVVGAQPGEFIAETSPRNAAAQLAGRDANVTQASFESQKPAPRLRRDGARALTGSSF